MDREAEKTPQELLREAHIAFLLDRFRLFRQPAAITLTFKQAIRHYRTVDDHRHFLGDYEPLDTHKASKAVREFLKRLSRRILLRRDFERGMRLSSVAAVERSETLGSPAGRLHYHLTIDLAGKPITPSEISAIWRKVKFAYDEIDVQPIWGTGWISYSVKNIGKFCNDAAGIDWNNCVLPGAIHEPKATAA